MATTTEIEIQGEVIELPTSGASPNWSEAWVQFAQATEAALTGVVGVNDVSPQVYSMPLNVNTNANVTALQFSTSTVRAAFVRYSVFRTTDSTTAYEAGNLTLVYSPANSTNEKWEIIRESVGDGSITFSVTDVGQVQYSTTSIAGSNHTGKITFAAQALDQA